MNLVFLFVDDYIKLEEEEFVSFIFFFFNIVKFFILYVINYFQILFFFIFEQGVREDDIYLFVLKINWVVNLDDDNYFEEDEIFVYFFLVSI